MCPRTRLWREIRRSCCGISTRSQGSNYDEQREDRISGFGRRTRRTREGTCSGLSEGLEDCRLHRRANGGRIRTIIRRILRDAVCDRREQRDGCAAICIDSSGVREGDAVVTVANTFIATTEAISQAGARPEFVDIDERTYNMDPEKLRNFLEQQCSREGAGKLVNRRRGRPVTAVGPLHLHRGT